jgi:hypothetical protein
LYQILVRWFKPRLPNIPTEDAGILPIRGPGAYLCNKIADTAAKEVAFWGESTPGTLAASRYR